MSDNNNTINKQDVETKKGISPIFANKNTLIIASVVVFVLLLAIVPILINVLSDKGDEKIPDNPDLGVVLSGTYAENIGVGSSEYTFNGDKVTNTYVVNGETKVIEYTYVIATENGEKVIKLTTVGDGETKETSVHSFEQGKFGETPIILINDVMYYLKEN